MTRSRIVQFALVALLAQPSFGASAPADADLAVAVARLMDVRGAVVETFINMIPPGSAREFAEREFAEHPEIWPVLEQEFALGLRETFSPKQLHELQQFLGSETGQAWIKASPALFERMQAGSREVGGATFQIASIGCVVGLLGPNVDAAKAKAGRTDPGIPAEMFEAARPLREAAKKTCDCLLSEGLKRWPSITVYQIQMQPEHQEYWGQLLNDGKCPLPVPTAQPSKPAN